MEEHTYNGVPVAQMTTQDICECLLDGISVNEDDGLGAAIAEERVRKRLELELYIRVLGLYQ